VRAWGVGDGPAAVPRARGPAREVRSAGHIQVDGTAAGRRKAGGHSSLRRAGRSSCAYYYAEQRFLVQDHRMPIAASCSGRVSSAPGVLWPAWSGRRRRARNTNTDHPGGGPGGHRTGRCSAAEKTEFTQMCSRCVIDCHVCPPSLNTPMSLPLGMLLRQRSDTRRRVGGSRMAASIVIFARPAGRRTRKGPTAARYKTASLTLTAKGQGPLLPTRPMFTLGRPKRRSQ